MNEDQPDMNDVKGSGREGERLQYINLLVAKIGRQWPVGVPFVRWSKVFLTLKRGPPCGERIHVDGEDVSLRVQLSGMNGPSDHVVPETR
jgi:hypothetical protein